MKIEKIVHENVKRNGTFEDRPGAVETDGVIRMSDGDGCGAQGCHCSDGHWISVFLPRNSYGIVEGIKVTFDDGNEMQRFFNSKEIFE